MCADHSHSGEHEHHHHHDHDHEQGHHHHHSHEHNGDEQAGSGKNRDLKILQYMIGHNAEHAQELRELAGRLRDSGKTEAADLIEKAVSGFETANAELKKAADLLS